MGALREYSRYELLLSQFQMNEMAVNDNVRQALERIRDFLYEHTDIHYLVFVREKNLISYIKYHCKHKFEKVSFIQVVEDIKIFIRFLEHKTDIKRVPSIDFSLQNLNMWLHL